MTNKVDWSNAPELAQFYSAGCFRYHDKHVNNEYWWDVWNNRWDDEVYDSLDEHMRYADFELRPTLDDSNCNTYNPDETPDYDESLDDKWDSGELGQSEDNVVVSKPECDALEQVATDLRLGNLKVPTVNDYLKEAMRYVAQSEVKNTTKTSIQFLDEVKAIQEERAAEYEQEGGERSFAKIATVFNTYTGHNLQPSDIALILEILKNVRFYSNTGYHKDSVIDALSYTSLWAELVTQERDKR